MHVHMDETVNYAGRAYCAWCGSGPLNSGVCEELAPDVAAMRIRKLAKEAKK